MQITKYDNLTTEELLQVAYNDLTDEDELALALMVRLADTSDELEQWKTDYAESSEYWDARIAKLEEEIAGGNA